MKLLSRVQLSVTPWTMARQAPLSMGFSRQENWSGLPFPSPMRKYEVSEVKSLSRVRLSATPRTVAYQAPRPWNFPGNSTGVGCHFLLQCMKAKSENEVAQSCPTLSNPMYCSPPGSPSMEFSRQAYWSGVPLPSRCN